MPGRAHSMPRAPAPGLVRVGRSESLQLAPRCRRRPRQGFPAPLGPRRRAGPFVQRAHPWPKRRRGAGPRECGRNGAYLRLHHLSSMAPVAHLWPKRRRGATVSCRGTSRVDGRERASPREPKPGPEELRRALPRLPGQGRGRQPDTRVGGDRDALSVKGGFGSDAAKCAAGRGALAAWCRFRGSAP